MRPIPQHTLASPPYQPLFDRALPSRPCHRTAQGIEAMLRRCPDILHGVQPHVQHDFLAWYPQNMNVVNRFEAAAIELKQSARRSHYGMSAIMEQLRWHSDVGSPHEPFKLNNNYRSVLARLIMAINPDLSGMFSIRERPAAP